MVHQLLVLHEAPPAEMASTSVPGDGAQVRGGRVAQQGGAASFREAVGTVGEQTWEKRSSHVGEWGRAQVVG